MATDSIQIKVGDLIIDGKALPLRMDTWNVLRSQGIDPLRIAKRAKGEDMDVEPLQRIAYAVMRKAAAMTGNGSLTDQQLDEAMSLPQVTRVALSAMSMEGAGDLDRPISSGSSVSPNGGAGGQVISSTSPSAN